MRRIFAATTLLASTLLISSCVQPGQYVIYRVAQAEGKQSLGCWPNGQIPQDEANDSTTFRGGDTFAIFASGDGVFWLDFAGGMLEGEYSGGTYTFEGVDTDINYPGDDGTQSTDTTILKVTVTVDQKKVSGKSVQDVSSVCVGNTCPDPPVFQCITTTEFVGSKIDGVDLEHAI
jgi:hypothetical protein